MARPRKCTVDYFPHDCQHKQTMFIVENRHGNDGYAFWFKLLELLGSTEGHFIDCRNEVTREFLQAKTRLDWSLCSELLDLLAKLGAIDLDLWKIQVVWSDNFLSRIKDVYGNRKVEIPTKPSFYEQKPTEAVVSTADNPQTKVKEMKGNKIKEDSSTEINSVKPARNINLVDDALLAVLEKNEAYTGINIRREYGKMLAWIETPKGRGKMPTKARFINWLNRATPCDTKPAAPKQATWTPEF